MERFKPTVLFVDDEISVLEGLRRSFIRLSDSLTVLTANSALKALDIVTKQPVDIIITDLRMPGMDGVQLLETVRHASPETTRIILSGCSERDVPFKTAGPAHRHYSKPCSSAKLTEVIVRTMAIRNRLRTPELVELVTSIKSIPALPKALMELLNEIQSPSGSVAGLARIIGSDVGLSAQVLKIANSGFFRTANTVNDVSHAVRLLGFESIRALVVMGSVFEAFKASGVDLEAAAKLQERSLSIGQVARRIAVSEAMGQVAAEQAQCAGMLAHIGSLILSGTYGPKVSEIRGEIDRSGAGVAEVEHKYLGVNHAELGAALLDLWEFPGDVVEAVLFHHEPSASGASKGISPLTVVHAAQQLVKPRKKTTKIAQGLDMQYLNRIGLGDHIETWAEIASTTLDEYAK